MIHFLQPSGPAARTRGICLYALAVAFLAAMDAGAKALAQTYSPAQITLMRSLFAFLPIAVLACRYRCGPAPGVRRPGLQCLRGLAMAASVLMFFIGLAHMPLAEATALSLAGPMLTVALSGILLGERTRPGQWAGLLVGFAGVLIIVRPGLATFRPEALVVLGAALAYALTAVLTRVLARTEGVLSTIVCGNLVMAAVGAAGFSGAWPPLALADLPTFALVGLAGGLSACLFVLAFRCTPASVLAPLDYSVLIWATALGWILWGETPDPYTCLGAAAIVLSGLTVTSMGLAPSAPAPAGAVTAGSRSPPGG